MEFLITAAGLLLAVATFLPLLRTPARWVRVLDFPRLQIAGLLGAALAAEVFYVASGPAAPAAMLAALGWQAWRIFPYTPLAPRQVRAARGGDDDSCVSLLIANVLMDNRNADGILRQIAAEAPDLVLLVETDAAWDRALAVLGDDYPHSVRQPQENYYGMILYSKLPLEGARVEYLVDENIPSIHAAVVLGSGVRFDFHGVHPVPPPLADTAKRDAELLIVGRQVRDAGRPAIVAGDLNDVGWSATTRLFGRISGLLDPRLGRGLYATYNARNPLLRWPLDHIFHDRCFTLKRLERLGAFGSDHYPVLVELCHEPDACAGQEAGQEAVQAPEPADGEDRAEARERIDEGLQADSRPDDYPKPK